MDRKKHKPKQLTLEIPYKEQDRLAEEWDKEHPFDKDILCNPYRPSPASPNDPWVKILLRDHFFSKSP